MQLCTSESAIWAGAASSSTSALSFTRRHALARISREMKIEINESAAIQPVDRKSTRLNSSHLVISYAVFCLKKNDGDRLRRDDHHRLEEEVAFRAVRPVRPTPQ